MYKKITGILLAVAVLATGLHFSPLADVTIVEDNRLSIEYSEEVSVSEEQENTAIVDTEQGSDTEASTSATNNQDSSVNQDNNGQTNENEVIDENYNNEADNFNEMVEEIAYTEEEFNNEYDISFADWVPDEPENVVEDEEDDYFEVDEEYVYDDRPFDASYITGEGVDRIKKVIIAYAESLGGTFRSPYYKGGKAVSVQCCAYVNQVWKHVFGKDIYDAGIMTTMSHEGETIYNFLERTGARSGDILYVRYWKVKKNDWSSHFMILLDYDKTGVYVTDGYETDEGKFVVWRINKKAIYSESNFFKRTGSDKSKPGSVHYSGRKGSFFKLYRMSQNEWCKVANSSYYEYEDDPFVRGTMTRINRNEGTFTVTAMIHSNNGLDRVQFPAWTVANGSDDLVEDYTTNEYLSGEIEDMGDDIYKVTYVVDIADHNYECGNYMVEMYIVDNLGVTMNYKCDAVNMDGVVGGTCVDYIPWALQ